MPDEHQPNQNDHTSAPVKKSYGAFVAAILAGLIIIAGCGYLVWKTERTKSKPAQPAPTASRTQTETATPPGFKPTFRPPAPTTGSALPSQPVAANQPGNTNPISNAALRSPRGPAVAGAEISAAATTARPVFLPYIETYPANDTTLDEIRQTLQDSPSVESIADTTYGGQPALRYTAYDPKNSGIAYIANNTIYYVHGS